LITFGQVLLIIIVFSVFFAIGLVAIVLVPKL
jgi:hypothetical protein